MGIIIDAKGLACPSPVILTKEALLKEDDITVIVDNEAAVENVRRMGIKSGCMVDTERRADGIFHLHLKKKGHRIPDKEKITESAPECSSTMSTPLVIVLSSDRMGRGNDELGGLLTRSFIHTLLSLVPLPDTLIFYNTGIKLVVKDSAVLDDLKQLEAMGVSLFVCGTCADYFGISNDLGAGSISNMYDIASAMAGAGRLVMP